MANTTTPSDAGARPYATVNPYTGETLEEFPVLETEQVDQAVDRAHQAFLSWRDRPVAERAQLVRRAGDLMLEREEELARLLPLEMGKLLQESHGEVQLAAGIMQYYGDRGPGLLEPEPLEVDTGAAAIVNVPLGVLLGVEPWNFPYYQVARFAAPNLVAGNTILLKHASSCPQSALALERLFRDAGVPEGVYTNLFLSIADVQRVIEHAAVQGASLTGSERAGASLAEIAGRSLKKCVLELGGSDPFVVLDGVDLERTVAAAAIGRLTNAGQSCVAAKRFIVLAELYDEFVGRLAQTFSGLHQGDPTDPDTTLAPLSSQHAVDDLLAQVTDAVDKGATLVTGGNRPDLPGAFVDATVLTDVRPGMRAFSEELFGPVAVVYRVADDDEAVTLANATGFGLGGTVISSDVQRAQQVANRIASGMVWINHPTSSEPMLPFGGIKRSGHGRELSYLGLYEFTNRKLVRTFPPRTDVGKVFG
jgi:succinate-semialdehyde dehydrogenase/glutarate-semialdehyde dehydrogenase